MNGPTLRMLRCITCGEMHQPHVSVCPKCLEHSFNKTEVPGTGFLITWTTIRRAPTNFMTEVPYQICVVELDNSLRIVGRLRDSEAIRCGARVELAAVSKGTPVFTVID